MVRRISVSMQRECVWSSSGQAASTAWQAVRAATTGYSKPDSRAGNVMAPVKTLPPHARAPRNHSSTCGPAGVHLGAHRRRHAATGPACTPLPILCCLRQPHAVLCDLISLVNVRGRQGPAVREWPGKGLGVTATVARGKLFTALYINGIRYAGIESQYLNHLSMV